MARKKILFATITDENFSQWCIWYKCEPGKFYSSSLVGYGKDKLKEHIKANTPVYKTGPELIPFILKYNNEDHGGYSGFSINLKNGQYLEMMIKHGAIPIKL